MNKLLIPNTTQVPNVLLDEVMPRLQGSALKVLLVVVRKTYGYGKQADKLSFNTLQQLTGLSRDAVNQGIKALGPLLQIKPGAKYVPKLEGVNEYALNVDIETGKLVGKSDWSENRTSPKSRKNRSENRTLQNQVLKPNMHGAKKRPTDPRVKDFIDYFASEYLKRFGEPYHVKGGKDGQLVKSLLGTFNLDDLKARAVRLWESPDNFISGTDRGIGVLSSQINRLNGAAVQPARPANDAPRGDLSYE